MVDSVGLKSPEDGDNESAPKIEPTTPEQCKEYLNNFIQFEKPYLKTFYKDDSALTSPASISSSMVDKLMKSGCSKELAEQFSVLSLYDLILLLG